MTSMVGYCILFFAIQLAALIKHKNKQVTMEYQFDRLLKSGVVITFSGEKIDFSLLHRLKEHF